MKTTNAFGFLLAACACLGTGYWFGHRSGATGASAPMQPAATSQAKVVTSESKVRAAAERTSRHDVHVGQAGLSLAEIQDKIAQVTQADRVYGREWQKILDSVAVEDIPPLLAAAERNPSKPIRDSLRIALL